MNKTDIVNEESAIKYLEERCTKTFVGLYTGKNVQVIIDPTVPTAHYDPLNLEIRIGTKMFEKLIYTNYDRYNELDLDKDAKTVLFHEIGHGIWTPTLSFQTENSCLPDDAQLRFDSKMTPHDAFNLFEDERMEHCMRKFLKIVGVDYKQLLYDLHRLKEGEYKETDCFNHYCFNLIRLHVVMFPQDYELLDKLRAIIKKYESVNNIVQDFYNETQKSHQEYFADRFAQNALEGEEKGEVDAFTEATDWCQTVGVNRNALMAAMYAHDIGKWYAEAYKSWKDNSIGVKVTDKTVTSNLEVAWKYDVEKNPNNYPEEKLKVIKLIQQAKNDKTLFKKLKMRLASEFLNRHKNQVLDENKKKVEEMANDTN